MKTQTFKGKLLYGANVLSIFPVHGTPQIIAEANDREVLVTVELIPEKTAGQVAYEARRDIAYLRGWDLMDPAMQKLWEESAQAVLDWHAVRKAR